MWTNSSTAEQLHFLLVNSKIVLKGFWFKFFTTPSVAFFLSAIRKNVRLQGRTFNSVLPKIQTLLLLKSSFILFCLLFSQSAVLSLGRPWQCLKKSGRILFWQQLSKITVFFLNWNWALTCITGNHKPEQRQCMKLCMCVYVQLCNVCIFHSSEQPSHPGYLKLFIWERYYIKYDSHTVWECAAVSPACARNAILMLHKLCSV